MNPVATLLNIAQNILGEKKVERLELTLRPLLINDDYYTQISAVVTLINNIIITAASLKRLDNSYLLGIQGRITLENTEADLFLAVEELFKYLSDHKAF